MARLHRPRRVAVGVNAWASALAGDELSRLGLQGAEGFPAPDGHLRVVAWRDGERAAVTITAKRARAGDGSYLAAALRELSFTLQQLTLPLTARTWPGRTRRRLARSATTRSPSLAPRPPAWPT